MSIVNKKTKIIKKATPRFELGIRALQAPALPLGHVASTYSSMIKKTC